VSELVAFLRAINVGGRQAKNTALRAAFERMGFAGVETFIASGNIIFSSVVRASAKLEQQIERELLAEFDLEMTTFLRTRAEVAGIAERDPFAAASVRGWKSLYVILGKTKFTAAETRALAALETERDRFAVDGREVYWRCKTVSTDSLVATNQLRRALGPVPTTSRNVTTFRRLAEKYPAR
jgi:uncharacterized protein (DUF1697 family)